LSGDVAELVFSYDKINGQHYYFDDIVLNESGGSGSGSQVFRVYSSSDEIYHVDSLKIILISSDSGWGSDSFANISGGLLNGILIRFVDTGLSEDHVLWSFVLKNNVDLFGYLCPLENMSFPDSSFMLVLVLPLNIASINVTDTRVLDIIIRDDLSSLVTMKAFLNYGVEINA